MWLGISSAAELRYLEPSDIGLLASKLKPAPRAAFVNYMTAPWFTTLWRLLSAPDTQVEPSGEPVAAWRRDLGLRGADDLPRPRRPEPRRPQGDRD